MGKERIERADGRTERHYWLLHHDELGSERPDPTELISPSLAAQIAARGGGDIVVMSHGWNGDVPGAKRQFQNWFARLVDALERRHDYDDACFPLLVGFHWPSLVGGREEISDGGFIASEGGTGPGTVQEMIDAWTRELEAPKSLTPLVETIVRYAARTSAPLVLPPDVAAALEALRAGVLAAERACRPTMPVGATALDALEAIDLRQAYSIIVGAPRAFATGSSGGPIISLLRLISFWRMKQRAHDVGQAGGHQLLRRFLDAAPARTRVHLFGHSFGAIVVSAMVSGPSVAIDDGPQRKVQARAGCMMLCQAALSTWAYTRWNQWTEAPGRFVSVLEGLAGGPVVTTMSVHDGPVRWAYPLGTGIRGLDSYDLVDDATLPAEPDDPAPKPKLTGVGTHGISGVPAIKIPALRRAGPYGFKKGKVYNVDARDVIKGHNDVAHPEVFEAFAEAMSAAGSVAKRTKTTARTSPRKGAGARKSRTPKARPKRRGN